MRALIVRSILTAALAVFTTSAAWAADVTLGVTNAPDTAKQGETKNFTINVSASGQLNISHTPGTVTVNTSYLLNNGSGTPDGSSTFTAPTTPAAGCEQ